MKLTRANSLSKALLLGLITAATTTLTVETRAGITDPLQVMYIKVATTNQAARVGGLVGRKQANVKRSDPDRNVAGDAYTFVALSVCSGEWPISASTEVRVLVPFDLHWSPLNLEVAPFGVS